MTSSGSDSGSETETAVGPPGGDGYLKTPASPQLGGVLGRYRLIEVLGHGAMATVFRARDMQLSREVAVKVMTLAVAARADSAERFRREARAVAAVKHPGIVEIFDFVGATDTDPAYIVSELIKGSTLRKFLDQRRGRLLPETAALIAMALADALHAAHVRGVVHRDIKPDNVMLEREGPDARVVLTDFGVAQVTGMETMTATGALVGSPSYMSPEQGRGDDVGPGSDLFSLGVLLYEMATGVLPFVGRDPLTVLSAISRGVFKRPSAVSPYAGAGIDDVSCRCLRGIAAERYPDAAALAADLRKYCAGVGIDDPAAALRSFLGDPDVFEAVLRPRIADVAVATARRHARRGELAKALAQLSRATAYMPGHAEAERLIARISSRRAWAKVAAVVSAVGICGVGLWAVTPWVRGKMVETAEPSGQLAVANVVPGIVGAGTIAKGVASKPTVSDKATTNEVPLDTSEPTARAGAALRAGLGGKDVRSTNIHGGKRSLGRGETPTTLAANAKAKAKNDRADGKADIGSAAPDREGTSPREAPGAESAGTAAVQIPAAVGADLPTVSNPTGAASEATTPAPIVAKPAAAPEVTLLIFAEAAFCTPSVDKLKPHRTPARYVVPEGTHQIHCLMPGGGKWTNPLHITTPTGGGTFRVQLRRDGQGRPMIDAGATSKSAGSPPPGNTPNGSP